MAKSKSKQKNKKPKQTPSQPISPVQPLDSTPPTAPPPATGSQGAPAQTGLAQSDDSIQTAPPVPTAADTANEEAQNDLQKQLDEANKRAEEAEAAKVESDSRAEAAEKKAATAERNLTDIQAPESPGIPLSQQVPDRFDKDGNELCWNCLNNGDKVVLEGGNTCPNCAFQKDKLYNGGIEAEKAGQRLQNQES